MKIVKISFEHDILRVYPAECDPAYGLIYRAARNVNWIADEHAFTTPASQRGAFSAWQELQSAISEELGLTLIIKDETEFVGLTPADRQFISSH